MVSNMKKWKCPECGNLEDYKIANVTGVCTVDSEGCGEIEEWEYKTASCEKCSFEETDYGYERFELVEVDE